MSAVLVSLVVLLNRSMSSEQINTKSNELNLVSGPVEHC